MKDEAQTSGVRCPDCGCRHAPVQYTKHAGDWTIRDRQCRACRRRFKTREKVVEPARPAAG